MKIEWCLIIVLVSTVLVSWAVYGQVRSKAIPSSKPGCAFIGFQFDIPPSVHVRMELLSKDSSWCYRLLDSNFSSAKTLAVVSSRDSEEVSSRYKEALILCYPELKTEVYFIRYSLADSTSQFKFLNMK